jgi:hypothetical protein
MQNQVPIAGSHPAPHRGRVALAAWLLGLVAAPAAWALNLLIKYALVSYACFPDDTPLRSVGTGHDWVTAVCYGVEVGAFAIAAAALWVSYGNWSRTREESAGPIAHLAEAGEGRTRFLSLWGMLIGALVATSIAFGVIANLRLPACQ